MIYCEDISTLTAVVIISWLWEGLERATLLCCCVLVADRHSGPLFPALTLILGTLVLVSYRSDSSVIHVYSVIFKSLRSINYTCFKLHNWWRALPHGDFLLFLMPLCSTSDCADGNNVFRNIWCHDYHQCNTSALWSSRMVDPGAAAVVMGRRGWAVLLLHSRFHPVLLWPVLGRPVVIASSAPYAIRTPT